MNAALAKSIGGRYALRFVVLMIVIVDFFLMLRETAGDFANGILFFMAAVITWPVMIGVALLLVSAWVMGRRAGVEILIKGKDYAKVGFKYGLIETALLLGWIVIVFAMNGTLRLFAGALWQLALSIIIPLTIAWLLAAWGIFKKKQAI